MTSPGNGKFTQALTIHSTRAQRMYGSIAG